MQRAVTDTSLRDTSVVPPLPAAAAPASTASAKGSSGNPARVTARSRPPRGALPFSAWNAYAGLTPARESIAIHIEAGLCSQTMCSVRTGASPARPSRAESPAAVKCWRWRGTSQCIQAGPPIRAWSEAALGTPSRTSPPGASQPATRSSVASGSSRCSATCHRTTASRPASSCSAIGRWRTSPTGLAGRGVDPGGVEAAPAQLGHQPPAPGARVEHRAPGRSPERVSARTGWPTVAR